MRINNTAKYFQLQNLRGKKTYEIKKLDIHRKRGAAIRAILHHNCPCEMPQLGVNAATKLHSPSPHYNYTEGANK